MSSKSGEILEFVDKTVLADYGKMEDLANSYRKDAGYYSDISNSLSSESAEFSATVQDIVEVADAVMNSQRSLNEAVQEMTASLQSVAANSEQAAAETEQISDSSRRLSDIVNTFHIQ